MNTNPFIRPAAALVLLASMLAASPSQAWWIFSCRSEACVARDQVKERAGREFLELRERVEVDYREDPNKGLFVSQIKETERRFRSQADEVLKRPRYNEWEFDYIGESVTKVIIPTIERAVEAAQMLPAAEAHIAFLEVKTGGESVAIAHAQDFANRNRERIEASAESAPGSNQPDAEQPGASAEDPAPGPVVVVADVGWRKPTAEEIMANSDIVKLAEASANYVKDNPGGTPGEEPGTPGDGPGAGTPGAGTPGAGTPGAGTPGAGTPGAGTPGAGTPGAGTPGAGTPGAGAPGSGTGSRPRGGGLIGSIASPAGVSQLYATNSLQSLESGNYREAYSLSQRALAINPNNRNAMEVYQAVKGRADAASARGESWSAAKAGASSLGAGARGPGIFGAASPPSGSAAVASPGAVRAATEHARSGAMNAMKLGDPAGAAEILSKALRQNPDNPALLNLRAEVYGRLGRWDAALKDLSAGLALAPGNMIMLRTKAKIENLAHRWRDARATAETMIAADPRSAWGYANRAQALAGLGDRDGMLSDIDRAAKIDPRFRQAAADAAKLQLPTDGDVLFLFPGEAAKGKAPAPVPAGRGRSFSVIVGAGIAGGLLLALGLLSTVLAPLKDTVVSVFTRAKRLGPATNTAVATAQPASAAGNVGGLIRGQYEISRQIGAGGMGMVYEGTDRSLGRRVAIKKMREELRVNPRERDRFIIEAKTVASLHHPNIVDIYAIAEEGDDVYLVFEYVDGKTVHDLVQGAGRLDPPEAVRVTRAMGDALTYAHAHGVIHRDMKPSNVMVTGAGQIKVMDFGIARMAKDAMTRYSMTNTVVGTPPYMAPEQEQGVVRKESDVYSLAVCSYEMLTGKMPFIGIGAGMLMNKINMSYIPPSRAIAGLPEALDEVFLKAFQADPDQRYRTPLEFVTALAAAGGARSRSA